MRTLFTIITAALVFTGCALPVSGETGELAGAGGAGDQVTAGGAGGEVEQPVVRNCRETQTSCICEDSVSPGPVAACTGSYACCYASVDSVTGSCTCYPWADQCAWAERYGDVTAVDSCD